MPLLLGVLLLQVVGAEPLVAGLALGQRVGERVDVAAGLPGLARQDDEESRPTMSSRICTIGLPPLALDVLLELHAERAVVPGRPGAAVDLAARVDEAPALGEGDDVVDGGRGRLGHGGAPCWSRPAGCRSGGSLKALSLTTAVDSILSTVPGSTTSNALGSSIARLEQRRPRAASRRTTTARGGRRRRSPTASSAPTASGRRRCGRCCPSTYPGCSASTAERRAPARRGRPRRPRPGPEPVHHQHARRR